MESHYFKPKFILKEGIHGQGIFTTVKISKGEILFEMNGDIINQPTRTSIQIGKNKHIEDDIGAHVNHNCMANAKIIRKNRTFISLRDIEPNEEITFDYNKNEDSISAPFTCHCCQKEIRGKLKSKVKI